MENAYAVLIDPDNDSTIYVGGYAGAGVHLVVANPLEGVVEQSVITQFPHNNDKRQAELKMIRDRENGYGQVPDPAERVYAALASQDSRPRTAGKNTTTRKQKQDKRQKLYTSLREPNMVALHNLSAANLRLAAEIGGISMPSIAIHNVDHPFEGFGEITLIGKPALIDPKTNRKSAVFDADAYSPRYPRMYFHVDRKEFDAAMAPIMDAVDDAPPSVWGGATPEKKGGSYFYRLEDDMRTDGLRAIERSPLVRWFFFKEERRTTENDPAYQRWLQERFGHLFKNRKLRAGETSLGRAKYKEYTLANVFAAMKRELLAGGEGGFNGPGKVRAAPVPATRLRRF